MEEPEITKPAPVLPGLIFYLEEMKVASLTNNQIFYHDKEGRRRSFRVGKLSKSAAKEFLQNFERIVSAAQANIQRDGYLDRWLAGLDDKMHQKLVNTGYVQPRIKSDAKSPGIIAFVDEYISKRNGLKESTLSLLRYSRDELAEFLKSIDREDMCLDEFKAGHAKDFREHLIGKGLSDNTIRRRCGRVKQFFAHAVAYEIINRNPFTVDSKAVPTRVRGNEQRQKLISREIIGKVIEACPDHEWRLLVALARYGGLRTPSEPLLLKWSDVLWDEGRNGLMRIHSPKTAHHEGKELRYIPLWDELRPFIEEAWELAQEGGSEYLITRYRNGTKNLRTQLGRIIDRAGVERWPKLWHNMRASRETELVNSYPIHKVCRWIGNSQAVAMEHYLIHDDDDLPTAPSGAILVQHSPELSGNEQKTGKPEMSKAL